MSTDAPAAPQETRLRPSQAEGPLYLSRLVLSDRNPLVAVEMKNAKSRIDRFMSLMPGAPRQPNGQWDRMGTGLIYRVEDGVHGRPATVLLQSRVEPDPALLPDEYGTLETKRIDDILDTYADGEEVGYRITINPTRKDTGSNTRRVVGGEERDAFWKEHARAAGLDVRALRATPQSTLVTGKMRVVLVRYDGSGVVTDADALRAAIRDGIGPARSYGAGLLSVT